MEEPDNLLRGPQTPVSTVRTMKNPLYLSTGPPAYNDIGPVYDKVGSFNDIIAIKNNYVSKNCTNLLYSTS